MSNGKPHNNQTYCFAAAFKDRFPSISKHKHCDTINTHARTHGHGRRQKRSDTKFNEPKNLQHWLYSSTTPRTSVFLGGRFCCKARSPLPSHLRPAVMRLRHVIILVCYPSPPTDNYVAITTCDSFQARCTHKKAIG